MVDARDEANRAREAARAARAEAERLRQEADRLRKEKRSEAHRLRMEALRLRHEAHDADRRARHELRDERRSGSRSRSSGEPAGESPSGASTVQELLVDGIDSFSVHQTAGKLIVRACEEGEQPGLIATGSRTPPHVEVTRDGHSLRIEIRLSTGWLFRRRQGATTVVRLPSSFDALDVDLGYGEVQVRDLTGRTLKVNGGAGDIRTYSLTGALEVDVGAGKIAVYDHSGLVRSNTGTGDSLIDIAAVAAGDYRVEVGMGRVELRLPEGEQVLVRASSGIGKKRVDYPSAGEDAPTRATVETGIGEAVVRARTPGKQPERPPVMTAKPQRGGARPTQPARRHEAEELRVLEMLELGKITSQEAAELIAALQGAARLPDEDDQFEAQSTT